MDRLQVLKSLDRFSIHLSLAHLSILDEQTFHFCYEIFLNIFVRVLIEHFFGWEGSKK